MTTFIAQESDLIYEGLFEKPVFALWGEPREIVSGLFDAFAVYGVSLDDFLAENSANLGEQGVEVDLHRRGSFSFSFDRVEWSLDDVLAYDLSETPNVLSRGVEWIRGRVPGNLFQTHLFTYAIHGVLEGTDSTQFLSRWPRLTIGIGQDLGSGQILNVQIDQHSRVQTTIDHSYSVPGGLFVQQSLIAHADRLDYGGVLSLVLHTFDTTLKTLQLELTSGPK